MIRIHDIKLDALEDLIEGDNGKPVLIAYWYKSYLRRIKDKFDVRELITNEDFKEWNQGKIPVAITHPESYGHTSWKWLLRSSENSEWDDSILDK